MANWNQNIDLIHGDDLLLYLTSADTVVAYATSVSIQVDSESIDTSSKFSCKWQSNMGGKVGYTISCDALYTDNEDGISFDDLLAMQVSGEQVEWILGHESAWTGSCETNPHVIDKTQDYFNGKAVVTSASLEAGNNSIATCSATFTGAGEIQRNGATIA